MKSLFSETLFSASNRCESPKYVHFDAFSGVNSWIRSWNKEKRTIGKIRKMTTRKITLRAGQDWFSIFMTYTSIFTFDQHARWWESLSVSSQTWHVFKFQHFISHHFQWLFHSFHENNLLTWWNNEIKFKLSKGCRNGCDLCFDVFEKLRSEPPYWTKKEGFLDHFLGADFAQI